MRATKGLFFTFCCAKKTLISMQYSPQLAGSDLGEEKGDGKGPKIKGKCESRGEIFY